ncbi:MAG: protein kinase, partial [Actinomycetota bacterium]
MRLMHDLVGDTLGDRYRLIVRLAGGGMGEVYKAHDLLLDRPVAVKVLQPSLAADPELVQRFKAEARAAARLTHPNVVAVYDWGSAGERIYYMVMEYVPGTDLRDLLVVRSNLEPAQAAEIVASVCDALAAAHTSGLVHRDIKPENVLIARDGAVKVADFGIAVVADVDRTMPGGAIPGTLRYLSPEQAEGRHASPASDVWAAGAVLAELVTGQPPLQGAGANFLRRRASEEPIPPSKVDPRVPEALDEIVVQACAIAPGRRFGEASDMAHALRRASVRSLPTAPPLHSLLDELTGEIDLRDPAPTRLERRRRRRRAWRKGLKRAAVTLLLLALVAGGGVAAGSFLVPGDVRVPDVTGSSQGSAVAAAGEAGLDLEVVGREHHFGTAPGEVVRQDPATGRIQEGDTIRVVVSAGLPTVEVPRVVGRPMERAGGKLESLGFEVGSVSNTYSRKRDGTVISQTPSAGGQRYGSPVDLVVSKGRSPVAVPSV